LAGGRRISCRLLSDLIHTFATHPNSRIFTSLSDDYYPQSLQYANQFKIINENDKHLQQVSAQVARLSEGPRPDDVIDQRELEIRGKGDEIHENTVFVGGLDERDRQLNEP
jgi:hypothetical protein